jgi:hypothetical protein
MVQALKNNTDKISFGIEFLLALYRTSSICIGLHHMHLRITKHYKHNIRRNFNEGKRMYSAASNKTRKASTSQWTHVA